ncbi:MAG: Asp-tRNA(Asn)/Glu-tRNA(Gln) amidotransferase subunit GatB [bacterium]|nr:Asp-tRNA(Asn)/Glu-tRNA(Gln) amidotransferase subunit GatB [bacterium]
MEWQITVGLEVHAELRTNTKMFCGCKNDPDEKHPNINICPVCMGHPGTLPVANEAAIKHVQRVGLALGSELQKTSHFDRKNYFYPDIPKGYQISQYKDPLVLGGALKGVKITRVHLEEDTARSQHNTKNKVSYVDFNRAGVPLMELVTEPDITSAKQAREFAEELQLVFQYLGASEANMEKGEMRCEANISVYQDSDRLSGTKVEVKNLNSFRSVEKAIEFEFERQVKLLEEGGKVKQETRGWDENKEVTFSQRSKESAHDYRYFPEPDLPPMEFSEEYFDELRTTIPELPEAKRNRFIDEYKLDAVAAEILMNDKDLSAFWEKMASEVREWDSDKYPESIKLASNYFTSDLLGLMKEKEIPASELLIDPENFAELIKMIVKKEITSRVAKDVLRHMVEEGGDPSNWVEKLGLAQVSDTGALEAIAKKIIGANPKAIEDYKKGKANAVQFLVGQMMKETRGAANPDTIKEILTKLI